MLRIVRDSFSILKQFLIFIMVFLVSLIAFSIISATLENAYGKDVQYIKVSPSVLVSDSYIYLGDIAEIHLSEKSAEYFLKKISTGMAPLPGEWRYIRGSYIKGLIKKYITGNVKIMVPEKVRVISRVKYISASEIKKELVSFLKSTDVWKERLANNGSLVLKKLSLEKQISIPARKIKVSFEVPSGDDLLGPTNVHLFIYDGERIFKKIWLRTEIAFSGDILVAGRDLRPGEIVNAGMVEHRKVTVDSAPSRFFMIAEEVAGKRVKSYLRKGFAITSNRLEDPPAVNFGDVVKIIAESGSILLVASGRAMGRGHQGETVRVQNTRTRKIINAVVIGQKEVRVMF